METKNRMHAQQFLLFVFIYLFVLFSCGNQKSENTLSDVPQIDSTAIKSAIKHAEDSALIAFLLHEKISEISGKDSSLIQDELIFSKSLMPYLYDSLSYQLIWDEDSLRKQMIHIFLDAEYEGLVPQDFHVNKIIEMELALSEDFNEKVERYILLTDGFIKYGNQLLNGKTDANSFEPTLEKEEKLLTKKMFKQTSQLLLQGDLIELFQGLRPSTHYYSNMVKGLKKYTALQDSGGWKTLKTNIKKIEPQDEYRTFIPDLRQRLLIEGDYVLNIDSAFRDSVLTSPIYDSTLVKAVQLFQKRHGLNPDGVIGKGTVKMLNLSAKDKVNLLKINLERARWVYHDLPKDYIFVNIPGYDLRFVKDSALLWTTRVVAGKVTSATPIFKDKMQYIVFNPTWTVPSSISNDEFLPKAQKDSTFFKRNNMELISRSGAKVNPDNIDFSSIAQGEFPYVVKQGAGGSNSLGQVKFIFPNPHFIYLHDTPSRGHFARERRAFSHGCIRVENPIKLSELILENQKVAPDSIQKILKTRKPKRLNLDEHLPVYLTYSTAFADNEHVYFFEDVYGRDKALLEALELH